LSYKSRERKRRKRAAQLQAQKGARRSESSADNYWLTPLVKAGACDQCECRLRTGRDGVYRHEPRELYCVACADTAGLFYRPSLRWERERGRKRPAQLRLSTLPKPKRQKQAPATGWRAAREWMSDEDWATTCEAMGKKAA
jgi:hypothetical protein